MKEMATQSSILAQEIPWTEKPGGLQSMGSPELVMPQLLNHHYHVHTHTHTHPHTHTHMCVYAKYLQLSLTVCNSTCCGQPGSSAHGILKSRILEWVAVPSSKVFPWTRHQNCIFYVSCTGRWVLYHQHHLVRYTYDSIHMCVYIHIPAYNIIAEFRKYS